MLLKFGMCKSRIVYFILCYNNSKGGLSFGGSEYLYLVFMYLRPRGVKNIYVHPLN